MAGRVLRENIRVDQWIGQGSTYAAAETAVMLGSEQTVRMVRAAAQPVIAVKEVQADGIAVQGTVEFALLYLDAEGELRSRRAQAGFSGKIPVEGTSPVQQAQVMASVTSVRAEGREGRAELSAQVLLTGMVTERAEVSPAVEVAAQEEIAQRFETMRALHTAQSAQMRQTVADTLPLAQEGMTRVVWQQAKPSVQQVLPMDGAVEVSGEVELRCLLAGETAGDLVWQEANLPFQAELVGDGFDAGAHIDVKARVREAEAHLMQTLQEDQEAAALQAECVLELAAECRKVQELKVLADAYPLSEEPFSAVLAQVEYIDDWEEAEQTQAVEAVLELPADVPPIRHIVGAFASPILLETADGEETRAEGLLRVTLLYRTDGQEGLEVYEQEVPFGVTFDEIGSLKQVWRVEIGQTEAQRITPLQARVRVQVEMEAQEAKAAWIRTVQEISEEGEPEKLEAGITLYYPEAKETMWDVAKRYRVREEALRRRNPDGKAPLMIYRRLTEF